MTDRLMLLDASFPVFVHTNIYEYRSYSLVISPFQGRVFILLAPDWWPGESCVLSNAGRVAEYIPQVSVRHESLSIPSTHYLCYTPQDSWLVSESIRMGHHRLSLYLFALYRYEWPCDSIGVRSERLENRITCHRVIYLPEGWNFGWGHDGECSAVWPQAAVDGKCGIAFVELLTSWSSF